MRTCINSQLDPGLAESNKRRDIAKWQPISDALDFMNASGLASADNHQMRTVDFYVSHEALLLEYEEAGCNSGFDNGRLVGWIDYMIWIGDRTRQPDGAHVEFCSGVQILLA